MINTEGNDHYCVLINEWLGLYGELPRLWCMFNRLKSSEKGNYNAVISVHMHFWRSIYNPMTRKCSMKPLNFISAFAFTLENLSCNCYRAVRGCWSERKTLFELESKIWAPMLSRKDVAKGKIMVFLYISFSYHPT